MTTVIQRQGGGYYTMPNRWVDAGYMAASPGSVTQVYLFLSRWADNATHLTAQPMRLISMKCGISEDVARKAVRILEAWGAITRHSQSGRNAANTWTLNELHKEAPEYPSASKVAQIPRQIAPQQTTTLVESAPPQSRGTYQPKSNNLDIDIDTEQENNGATQSDQQADDGFEAFWVAFPKGYGNKKAARDQWKKLKPDSETIEAIMTGLEQWKTTERWQKGFVKSAQIWIRDRWWEDDIPAPAKETIQRHVV